MMFRVLPFGVACFFGIACSNDSVSDPAPPPPAVVANAGTLKLFVETSPWRMHFQDESGRDVLVEHGGTSGAPTGTLGLHVGPPPEGSGGAAQLTEMTQSESGAPAARSTGWVHATRVLEAHAEDAVWVAKLVTTDPARRMEVRARAAGDGVIEVRARALMQDGIQAAGIAFDAAPGERFAGFGERSNGVHQDGRVIENYVGEGPYQDSEYDLLKQLVPPWGIRWRRDATYFPMPWLLSSRGYGVLLDNDELSYHRLGTEPGVGAAAWSAEVESPELVFRVFAGPRPADVVKRFSETVGRQPRNIAPWFLGPWVQPGDDDGRVAELRAKDVPTSVSATYLHYLPCGGHEGKDQEQHERVAKLRAQGTAVHTYFNPMICEDFRSGFDSAKAQDALIKDKAGQPYIYAYRTQSLFNVSQFDFSAPNGISNYAVLTRKAVEHGYEGWMEDFGEYTPLDAIAADGATGTRFHNRYARDYHCGVFRATADAGKPLARFVRSGWTGSAACSPIVWGGDPTSGFGFDGLESSIYQALSMGTSGVGLWGSDIGGYFAFRAETLTPELLDRWIAFGGLSTIMRNETDGIALPPNKKRPQIWEDAHRPIWRRYAKLHTQLYPYIRAAVEEYFASGMPVMRHHVLTHPEDARAIVIDDQYMFGPDLLVAPVYVRGATERTVYLPPGQWVDFWRAVTYDETTGAFTRTDAAPAVLEGGRTVTVAAPITEIPMFVRKGAILPMLPADVVTLATYGDASIVHLADRENQVRSLVF